ncbi:MAG: SDR family NAD(P)-dependent oxidoreductase, partial [Leptothrix sp. (in: b-proteobacteria)]
MNTPPRQLAVVVGATGAFGQAIVERLVGRSLTVLAVARSAASLAGLAEHFGAQLVPCAADIADDSAIDTIRAAVVAQG